MSHPYLALYNEGVLLILWTIPRCLVVFSLIQLNLWLLRNSVYFAWKNTMTLYLSVCLPVCLCDYLTVKDADFPFQFCSPCVFLCSTCVFLLLSLTACLSLIFHLLLGFSLWFYTDLALTLARMEKKLNVCWICYWRLGGLEEVLDWADCADEKGREGRRKGRLLTLSEMSGD